MKYIPFTLTLIFLIISNAVIAQHYKVDPECKEQVSRLNFMTGQWEGSGWMMGPGNQKFEFQQTENIRFKLDSTILLIEGKGVSNGEVIHNALAIVSYDKDANNYKFHSYLKNGQNNVFKGELADQVFTWYPREGMRYKIWINEEGHWMEKGDRRHEGEWIQFFEMELQQVNPQ